MEETAGGIAVVGRPGSDAGRRLHAWALDIGASKILLGRGAGGVLRLWARGRTPERPQDLTGWVRRHVEGDVVSLGVAFPGGLDGDGRVTAWPNRPAWNAFELGRALGEVAQRVVFHDDGVAAASGENVLGVARGLPDVLVAVLGSGLGGAVVLDHRVRAPVAGEPRTLGHVRIFPDGVCPCGGTGCAQTALGSLPPDAGLGDGLTGWPRGARLADFLADTARLLAVLAVVLTGGLMARPVLRGQFAARLAGSGVQVLVPERPGMSSLLGAALEPVAS